ncbi:MAG: protein kinase [Chloroflexota bacterium]
MQEERVLNNRYELIERIGSGGMAAVYKARDRALGRLVAIKMLHESFTSDEGFLRRFQQEAYAAANLTHPNIVTVHDIGQDGHYHYIVMEFVDGLTMKQIIRSYSDNGDQMPLNRTLDLAIGVCNGIGYAHRAGLVHCDVKPHNILVTPDERIKVADFGIARAITEATQHEIVSQVWGTPQYFAPEQASGQPMTPATDVYAIGIVMFEMLTGRLPFIAESHTAIALKHLHEPPPKVTAFNTAVPEQISQIINKILAKEPTGRYRTAGQLGRILSTYRQRTLSETNPQTPTVPQTTPVRSTTPVHEQVTQIYERSKQEPAEASPQTVPNDRTKPNQPARERPTNSPVRQEQQETVVHAITELFTNEEPDWTAITLGIAALVALLGLIPLWILVYLAWT